MNPLIFLLLGAIVAVPQTHQHAPPSPETRIDVANLPVPQRIDGIGRSHISITTKVAAAQEWFDQGLALLHCFWDYEAQRAFAQAVRLDPDCAMCHWGFAQAIGFRPGHDEQVQEEMKKAKELGAMASDPEQRYIRAYAPDGADGAFAREMEALIDRYPNDIEAKLLYAASLLRGYNGEGNPNEGAQFGQSILRNLLNDHPDNAAANHYWIHALESSSHPEWATASAEKLGVLAPGSGHMVHMPAHIFYRIGDYERAHRIFLDGLRVDRAYMDSQHVDVKNNWNYGHNISYLIANGAESGRYKESREYSRLLEGLSNDPDHTDNPAFYVVQIGSTAARLAIRYGNWDAAASEPMQFGVTDDQLSPWVRGYKDGLLSYARAMQALESGRTAEAENHAIALDALLWRLSKEKIEGLAQFNRDTVIKILSAASLEFRGVLASRKGDVETALALLEQAAESEKSIGYTEPPRYSRPVREVLGHVLIRASKFVEAREAFGKALVDRPRSGFALYGIALSWETEGNSGEARKAYQTFLEAWAQADADLPQVKAAHAYLAR